ncbi:hypothetical protein F2Q68_00024907 [Brassica cretica]|uniref:Replication factor A C-terminal domain-containing protein n=1 Tax=Brassica cretica TaxID=69181 RepID=A0A8S9I7A8_BRACR|nr:hypothetical protein F2Q68_00024907 [Brassica cretica]
MAISRIFFSDLKSGKYSSVVEARLLRYWEARNVKRGGELMWIDMLLMDVNSTIMQATINANRVSKFRERLAAGSMYSVSGFDVARCAQNFHLADSPLMIRFNDSTDFDVLVNPVSPLPEEGFRFCNQTELVGLANTNSHLPDVIGEITTVKSTVCEPPEDKNRVMVTVRLENDVSVTLSLFDAQAVSFHQKLEGMRVDRKVIVATNINPKMVGGRLFLNATSGTHVYYDKETNAGESFFYRLVARDTALPSAAPVLRSYGKVIPMTIAELNDFMPPLRTSTFYAPGESRVLKQTMGGVTLHALSAVRSCRDLSLRSSACVAVILMQSGLCGIYRVEMVIADDTTEGTFVCFDGVMTKLHNLMAKNLIRVIMAISGIFFSDLKSGKCSSVVEARLLRYWEARNVKRGGELMWIDMLLMDVNSTIMQATINANRVSKFRERLAAGSMFSVSGFDVARCAQNFRLADSPLMMRFNDSTDFDVLVNPVSPLPEEGSRPDVSVTLSLFDAQAVSFHQKLEGMRVDPKVIVATNINPKMVGGRLFLNATSGTHVYYDKETNAGESFFYRLVARDNICCTPTKDIDFLCTGRVSRVETDNGWCYVACSKCSKKMQRSVSSFECVHCSNPNAIGSLRYRVEMVIADDTAEGTFVCFDGVMTKLHNLMASEAVQLLAEEGVNPEDSMMPPFVAAMEGKTYT